MKHINFILSALLAGLCISIGCIVNLSVGGGIPGAVLFSVGLISVVSYQLKLYTGTAGFINLTNWKDYLKLIAILGLNAVGCLIVSEMIYQYLPNLIDASDKIVDSRLSSSYLDCIIRGLFCGFLMTLAVKFARQGSWLPLLFAVPVFILSGFYHSIADAFYYSCSSYGISDYWDNWLMTALGNFIGCNLYLRD